MTDWYQMEVAQAARELRTDLHDGLDEAEAARRLAKHGPNELTERSSRAPWRILWEQFTSTMVLILVGAAVLSAVLGELKDAIAIGTIVVLFGLLGFVQEYRAEQAMAALKRLAVPIVRVVRQKETREISARELVPGDILLLEAGNLIPADTRLVESANLRIQESALTGESEAVEKGMSALPEKDLPLGDRRNMAYMGTQVSYGRGRALVTSTGMQTELGRIAALLQGVEGEQTPLQRRLDQLGKLLAGVGVAVAGLIFVLGLLRGEPLREMLLTSVSIAVAVVPEGLPAVVTITLALGAQRMLKRKALIRKLPAVETLGSVTVICSDKTGTLTENRMTVIVLDVAGHQVNLKETFRHHMPSFEPGELQPRLLEGQPPSVGLLLTGSTLCNDALLKPDPVAGRFHTLGDPTEGALLIAAAQAGLEKERLQTALPRIAELPFDSDRKRMTTIHRFERVNVEEHENFLPVMQASSLAAWQPIDQPIFFAFTKGAVDGLLEVSTHVWVNESVEPMNEAWERRVREANDELASQGMRVLGLAYRQIEAVPENNQLSEVEQDLVLVGMVGMIDPPRAEVKEAVSICRSAGIRPVMITGDHPLTAQQIARELGIAHNGNVLTGQQLAAMNEGQLLEAVDTVSVFARVSPEHKLRIVEALQKKGHVVAMTGDGVNDAPALRRADIGVAMGITGTDVSKEASEMVLQDDNFATIVSAVEEGRTIYDNLRKFVKYSVAGNIGKVLVMLLAPFLGKPLPLLPLQLLWLNLLTDGLLGLALGVERPERNVMQRPPYSPQAGIFADGLGRHVIWVGTLIGSLALGVGYLYWLGDPNGTWQTMVFTTLAFAQLGQALATRSTHESLFTMGLTSNKPGLVIAILVFFLQLAVLYVPFMQSFFKTLPLTLVDLGICLGLGFLVFAAIEIEKWIFRRRERGLATA